MWWQLLRTGLIGVYAYLVIDTVWQDFTMPRDVDGTLMMSAIVFFLWPVSILMLWSLVNDLRSLRAGLAQHPGLRWVRVVLVVLALSALVVQVAAWLIVGSR